MATKKQKAYSKKRGLNKRRKTMKGGFGWEDFKKMFSQSSVTSTTDVVATQQNGVVATQQNGVVATQQNGVVATQQNGVVTTEHAGGKKQKKTKSKSKSKSKK